MKMRYLTIVLWNMSVFELATNKMHSFTCQPNSSRQTYKEGENCFLGLSRHIGECGLVGLRHRIIFNNIVNGQNYTTWSRVGRVLTSEASM